MRKLRLLVLMLAGIVILAMVSPVMADTQYTVKPDDSLAKIARQFGTTYLALAAANGIEEPYIIQAGQVLIIPGADVAVEGSDPVSPQTAEPAALPSAVISPEATSMVTSNTPGIYRVQSGDSMSKIAKNLEFGVVEIEADAGNPGILAQATQLISSHGISIRQAHAGDPELEEVPKLTVITEKSIPGELFGKFLEVIFNDPQCQFQ